MAKEKLPSVNEYTEREKNDRAKIASLLRTEGGKTLFAWMERQFDGSLVKRNTEGMVDIHQTSINIGAREVVVELRAIRDSQDREDA